MKLNRAIEIAQLNLDQAGKSMPPDCKTSLKLLIEAAIRLKRYRFLKSHIACTALPGEEL